MLELGSVEIPAMGADVGGPWVGWVGWVRVARLASPVKTKTK